MSEFSELPSFKPQIPQEASALINQFKAEEAAKGAQRETTPSEKPKSEWKKVMTATDVERLVHQLGFRIEGGHGKHGKHIIAPNGRQCPLPDHGGGKALAIGTARSIRNFVYSNAMPAFT